MASTSQCLDLMARLSLSNTLRPSTTSIPRILVSAAQTRRASNFVKKEKKKRKYKEFKTWDLKKLDRYSLCDAVRYLRATEVGRPPSSVKYELAIKFGTVKNGPVVRNRIRLPYPVLSSVRIGVICKEGSKLAEEARQAGAVDVGEESLYEAIRTGNTTFNRLLCHGDCQDSLKKANLGRILGPKGLMPNPKQRTVTHDVVGMMREMLGAGDYREKMGVVRVPIGMLGFTPQMLAENVTAFMKAIKKELAKMEDMVAKDVQEVVLSSTNGPGLSLSGAFNPSDESIAPEHLATAV